MGNLVWLSCVVVLVLIGITCDWVSCWVGWSSLTSAGTGCLCSMWSLIFQRTSPTCSCLDRVLREGVGVCKASWSLGLEPAHHHVYILLAKASHKASPDSNVGEVDSTSFFFLLKIILLWKIESIVRKEGHVNHDVSIIQIQQLPTRGWSYFIFFFIYNYSPLPWVILNQTSDM